MDSAGLPGVAGPLPARRPNFLIFITDQQRADHLACMGNRQLRTPHIDALASRGVVFDRFHANAPVCMPNRAALATGRMPGATGVHMNGVPLPLSAVTYADAMREAGYRTALIGKAHFQNMTAAAPSPLPAEPGVPRSRQGTRDARTGPDYEREMPQRWRDDTEAPVALYYGFEHTELCTEHGDQVGGDYGLWLRTRAPELERLRFQVAARGDTSIAAPQAWRSALPPELYPTSYVAERTSHWLRAHAATPRPERQPFLLHCSFPDPHHPFSPPAGYWDRYPAQDIALPTSFSVGLDGAPPHKRALHEELHAGRRNARGSRAIAVHANEARQAIALNYGAISLIDDAVGRVMNTLSALDLDRDTVVVFLSDHGDFMGDHGLLFKGPLHYQSVLRMPFIWRDPAGLPRRCDALASAIDLAPTLLERAGVPLWHGLQGRSLLPLAGTMGGPCASADERSVLIEEHSHHRIPGLPMPALARSLVAGHWRLSIYPGADWGELYDLREDPDETINRFDDAALITVRAELLWRMGRQMAATAPDLPVPVRMA